MYAGAFVDACMGVRGCVHESMRAVCCGAVCVCQGLGMRARVRSVTRAHMFSL